MEAGKKAAPTLAPFAQRLAVENRSNGNRPGALEDVPRPNKQREVEMDDPEKCLHAPPSLGRPLRESATFAQIAKMLIRDRPTPHRHVSANGCAGPGSGQRRILIARHDHGLNMHCQLRYHRNTLRQFANRVSRDDTFRIPIGLHGRQGKAD